jgi:hypothetical protein
METPVTSQIPARIVTGHRWTTASPTGIVSVGDVIICDRKRFWKGNREVIIS